MKITKYLHSCLLVENQKKTILFDPGNFTYEQKVLTFSSIPKLDYLLITHSHPDHCDIRFVKEIVERFPYVEIISNQEVANILLGEGITVTVKTEGNNMISLKHTLHHKNFDGGIPQNTIFTLWNSFLHPGDTYEFSQNMEIIALPVQAAWGSTREAFEHIITAAPKYVVPIHDWHWRDEVRENFYKRLTIALKKHSIEFVSLETGDSVEL
jgi:L-ascorbate metabolism protein UlaG (beta-lactamase superfamily)